MILYIDTSDSERINIGFDAERFYTDSKREKSQRLLGLITEKLIEKNLSIQDIEKIEVNTGPGSFTGLRVGLAVAQALGWALGVEVNGKRAGKENIDITY